LVHFLFPVLQHSAKRLAQLSTTCHPLTTGMHDSKQTCMQTSWTQAIL